ncbi:MAG TPA: insulinase family protein [Allosphingosinicella sp.]
MRLGIGENYVYFVKVKWLAAAAVLTAAATPVMAIDPLPADAKLETDPAIETGTLANGLRYAIAANNAPADAVSLRLVVQAGSFDEEEGERGFAHFIEHLAFRSTRGAPRGTLDNRLGAFGVAIGRDQNAFTGLTSTVYKIDFPRKDMKAVAEVLGWMRDAADGIVFAPEAVDAERNVVLAELRTRSGAANDATQAIARFQAAGLRSGDRDPGGTPQSLAAARPETLQAFHRRWYRPDNAAVVVTGAIDAAEIKALLQTSFGSWRVEGDKPRRAAAATAVPQRAPEALTIASAAMPQIVAACRMAPLDIDGKPSMERLRREALSGLWTQVLNARLGHRTNSAGSGLLGAGAVVDRESPDAKATCVIGVPAEGKWQDAVVSVEAEMRRLATDGPTAKEVGVAIQQLQIIATTEEIGGGTRKTPALADEIVEAESTGTIVEAPAKRLESLATAIGSAMPADIRQAIAADWTGTGPAIVLVSPEPVDREKVAAAWTSSEKAQPLAAYADAENVEWPYVDFGKKGKVAKRLATPVPGLQRFLFKNGVILSFRKTESSEPAQIRVVFGYGQRALSPALRQPAQLAAGMVPIGGLGRLDYESIRRAIGHDAWVFNLAPGTDAWMIGASAYPHNLEQELQVLAAYLTDPGFGPLIDEKIPTGLDIAYRASAAEPTVAALDAIEEKFFPDQKSYPPRESLREISSADLAKLLKPLLTGAPLELTVVGNITEKQVRNMVASTFGALPPRAPLAPPQGPGPFRHFTDERPAPLTAFHQGPADKAAVMVAWPLWVASPERRLEEYAINLLAAVFEHRLLQRLRVETGRTYAPSVSTAMPDGADQGVLTALVDGASGEANGLLNTIREVAADLAGGKIEQEDIDRAREPLIAQSRQSLATDAAWADTVAGSVRHPEILDEVLGFEAQMKAVTLPMVRGAASGWLARAPVVGFGMPAPAGASTTKGDPLPKGAAPAPGGGQ